MRLCSMWYDIDFKRYVYLLLPPALRKPLLRAWLMCIIAPFQTVYAELMAYRKGVMDRLNFSGHVQYLEKVLNDEYGMKGGEIFITDVKEAVLYTYLVEEKQAAVYLRLKAENGSEQRYVKMVNEGGGSYMGAFVVNVPSLLDTSENMARIRALLNYYKPAGRKYMIVIY